MASRFSTAEEEFLKQQISNFIFLQIVSILIKIYLIKILCQYVPYLI